MWSWLDELNNRVAMKRMREESRYISNAEATDRTGELVYFSLSTFFILLFFIGAFLIGFDSKLRFLAASPILLPTAMFFFNGRRSRKLRLRKLAKRNAIVEGLNREVGDS